MVKKSFRLRWIYLAVGIFGLFYAGIINAYSTLMLPVGEEFSGWSKAQLSAVYTCLQSTFCFIGMVGGFTADKINSRWTLRIASVLELIGFLFASLTHSYPLFCLTFGILSGAGMGLVYNAIVRTVVRWFPDRTGMASGLLLMGFGMAGFIIGKLFQGLTPESLGGWRLSFRFIGISSPVLLFIVSFFVLEPEKEDLPENLRSTRAAARADEFIGNYALSQVLRNPAFILYYIYVVFVSLVGAVILSNATGIALETAPGMSLTNIATLVGMMPFANGIGRVLSGILTDRLRVRKTSFLSCTVFMFACMLFILALLLKSPALLIGGFLTSGLAYGSLATVHSGFAATRFGFDHYAINFAFLNTTGIFSSILTIPVGALYDRAQSWLYPILAISVSSCLAFLFRALLFKYERRIRKNR